MVLSFLAREETEALKGSIISTKSHSCLDAELIFKGSRLSPPRGNCNQDGCGMAAEHPYLWESVPTKLRNGAGGGQYFCSLYFRFSYRHCLVRLFNSGLKPTNVFMGKDTVNEEPPDVLESKRHKVWLLRLSSQPQQDIALSLLPAQPCLSLSYAWWGCKEAPHSVWSGPAERFPSAILNLGGQQNYKVDLTYIPTLFNHVPDPVVRRGKPMPLNVPRKQKCEDA